MDYGVCLPLYGGCVAWTLLYDTLYAHQDKRDDSKLKLRSSALTIGDQNTPMFLRACGVATVGGLGLAGFNAGFHDATAWPFYASLATFAAHLAWQVETAELDNPANLGARFRSNGAVAPVVLIGVAAATLWSSHGLSAASTPWATAPGVCGRRGWFGGGRGSGAPGQISGGPVVLALPSRRTTLA